MHSTGTPYGPITRDESLLESAVLARNLGNGEPLLLHDNLIDARDYQIETIAAIRESRSSGSDTALVHLATGLGKTVVSTLDTLDFVGSSYRDNGQIPKILFACHQVEILEQTSAKLSGLVPELTQGWYAAGAKELGADITFATLQSLHHDLDKIEPGQFDYIVYDEAHHAQAETYKRVIEYLKPSFALALTATPERMDQARIEDLFGETVYSKPLSDAIGEGYLADVDYHIVFDEAVRKAMDEKFDPKTLKEIRELLTNESRNEEIAKQIQSEIEANGLVGVKTIVFCASIEQANEMAELLSGKAYHSDVDSDKRREIMKDFRSGEQTVITTRDMFNEGVDIPDARLIVFLRTTSSNTIFEQQLGRGLRRSVGKDSVTVLDFVANIERLVQIRDLRDKLGKRGGRGGGSSDGSSINEGLDLHTDHADFEFEKLSVILLEKIANTMFANRGSWSHVTSIKDAADLWKATFGDEEPTQARITEAARNGEFIPGTMVQKLGGGIALKAELGFDVSFLLVETVEEAAEIWRARFGDTRPTTGMINQLSVKGEFMSSSKVRSLGGVKSLQEALGHKVIDLNDISTIDEVAALWQERFGDVRPTSELIGKASKERLFMSMSVLKRLGGLGALQGALGYGNKQQIETIEDAAVVWKELFGDAEPSSKLIAEAAASKRFIGKGKVAQLGGVDALRTALGFKVKGLGHITTIEEAAVVWKAKFGDIEPTTSSIREASKQKQFLSTVKVGDLGGVTALRIACGLEASQRGSGLKADDEQLIRIGKDLSPERPLTKAEIDQMHKDGLFPLSYQQLLKRFGGIIKFQKACGFEVKDYADMDNDELAKIAHEISPDKPLSSREIKELRKNRLFAGYDFIINRFGSIERFHKACGFDFS